MKWVYGRPRPRPVMGFYERAPLDGEFWTRLWRLASYKDVWRFSVDRVIKEHSRATTVEQDVREAEVTRGELWSVLRHLDLIACPYGEVGRDAPLLPDGEAEHGVWVLRRALLTEDMAAVALLIEGLHERHRTP